MLFTDSRSALFKTIYIDLKWEALGNWKSGSHGNEDTNDKNYMWRFKYNCSRYVRVGNNLRLYTIFYNTWFKICICN